MYVHLRKDIAVTKIYSFIYLYQADVNKCESKLTMNSFTAKRYVSVDMRSSCVYLSVCRTPVLCQDGETYNHATMPHDSYIYLTFLCLIAFCKFLINEYVMLCDSSFLTPNISAKFE